MQLEDGDSRFVRNISNYLRIHMSSFRRILLPTSTMKTEVTGLSKTSAMIYVAIWWHRLEYL
jgi:hypothetical protein